MKTKKIMLHFIFYRFPTIIVILFFMSCHSQPPDIRKSCFQIILDWKNFIKDPKSTKCDFHDDCIVFGNQSQCGKQGRGYSSNGVSVNKFELDKYSGDIEMVITCSGPFTLSRSSDQEPNLPECYNYKCRHKMRNCSSKEP